jgi:hypothetical protein
MMEEVIPLLLGTMALLFAFRWLLGGPERPQPPALNGGRGEGGEDDNGDDEGTVQQLAQAFPAVPVVVIRQELRRHRGDLDAATDALLGQSLRLAGSLPPTQASAAPSEAKFPIDLAHEADDDGHQSTSVAIKKGTEEAKRWEKDCTFRADCLRHRKLHMIREAQRYHACSMPLILL